MTAGAVELPMGRRPRDGGTAARRAVIRWSLRLFRREWRQQILIVVLLAVAVGATILASAVATNTPPAPNVATFGTANYLVALPGTDPHLAADLAALRRLGPVDVIESKQMVVPGTVERYEIRAQDPHGPYGGPTLSLVSGHYPTGSGEIAVTSGLASDFHLTIGDVWHQGGQARRVVGIVQNPQNLLDEFALVPPGQLRAPDQVTVLLDASPAAIAAVANSTHLLSDATIESPQPGPSGFNPAVVVLAVAVFGLFFIGLVAVAGFTVMAQRRLRALGMLGAVGATDRNIRLVMLANGAVVGVVATVIGAVLGFAAWLAYAPHLAVSASHAVGRFHLPWAVVITALVLGVVTPVIAAWWPARAAARLPVVAALSGRPAPPKPVHRSAVPGLIALGIGVVVLLASGAASQGGGGLLQLAVGLISLIVAVLFLAPMAIAALAALGKRAPIAVRLALRDLSRYRARSGAALGAISVAIVIAVITCVTATIRYSDVLDYVGPNLQSNQLIVYSNGAGPGGGAQVGSPGAGSKAPTNPSIAQQQARANLVAAALGTRNVVELAEANATLLRASGGNNSVASQPYIATPALLSHYGIRPSQINPGTLMITSRPGLAGMSGLELLFGPGGPNGPGPNGPGPQGCPLSSCVPNPTIQYFSNLPTGTSAPNLLVTMHGLQRIGQRQIFPTGWLIQTARPLTAAQINQAKQLAAVDGMTVESRNDEPSLAELRDFATAAGILLALGVLAMTVGLLRSETANDLRTLSAAGARSTTRRALTGATAGGLGLLGGLLGTIVAYVALLAWFGPGQQLGQSVFANLSHVPVEQLLFILIGMPLIAAIGGWLLAGRQPPAISRHALE